MLQDELLRSGADLLCAGPDVLRTEADLLCAAPHLLCAAPDVLRSGRSDLLRSWRGRSG